MRWLRLLLWPAGVVVGLAAERTLFGWDVPRHWIPDLAVGWTFIACGLIASARRPESRTGTLMTAVGFTWFLGNFDNSQVAAIAWVAARTPNLYYGPLVHLVLAYPTGRAPSRLSRAAIGVGYVAAILTPVWNSERRVVVWPDPCSRSARATTRGRSAGPGARASWRCVSWRS